MSHTQRGSNGIGDLSIHEYEDVAFCVPLAQNLQQAMELGVVGANLDELFGKVRTAGRCAVRSPDLFHGTTGHTSTTNDDLNGLGESYHHMSHICVRTASSTMEPFLASNSTVLGNVAENMTVCRQCRRCQ